jgi:predicted dithiol-disulfide oxidoreductase (DUF899 family)
MDAKTETLTPAIELARHNPARVPHESAEYRAARTALLAEEIELRRHIERVAAMRRALPPGAPVQGDYRFVGEAGESDLAGLFGEHETLVVFNYMFGPERARACPMCTDLLDAWNASAPGLAQQLSLAIVTRSPIERLMAWKSERGWKHLRLYQDLNWDFTRDYVGIPANPAEEGAGTNVFTRQGGEIRHFWANEMWLETMDPGQDPRGAPDPSPLWNVLDMTPAGRRADWYPKLSY